MTVPGPRRDAPVAYFTMEVALDDALPTFSGGLGVLAGDVLRSAADLGEAFVAVSICWRDGYFRQVIEAGGRQRDEPVPWQPASRLERLPVQVGVEVGGSTVALGCWRYVIRGIAGDEVPVYFLDSNLEENGPEQRAITDQLYGGDLAHRLAQEIVLGLGGPAVLGALGVTPSVFHMNEGHSALLTLAALEAEASAIGPLEAARQRVRERCVFTTHTPVAAGHDVFPPSSSTGCSARRASPS